MKKGKLIVVIILGTTLFVGSILGVLQFINWSKDYDKPFNFLFSRTLCEIKDNKEYINGLDGVLFKEPSSNEYYHCVDVSYDAGKTCYSSSDCEGICRPRGVVIRPNDSEYVDEEGYVTGTCSEFAGYPYYRSYLCREEQLKEKTKIEDYKYSGLEMHCNIGIGL